MSDDGSLTITPSPLNFGNVPVGSSGPVTFTLTNPGTTSISLGAPAISGPDTAQFAIVAATSCGTSLAAGASCSGTVAFRPTSAGAKSALLTVGPVSTSLTGTGVGAPLVIAPSTLEFDSVAVGSSSSPQSVTLTNTTSASLNIAATSATGDVDQFAVNVPGSTTCGSSLAAGASCTTQVTFNPTSAGNKTAVWTMAGSTLTFRGTATATTVYRINAGSSSAVAPFGADQYSSGGTQHSVTNTINVTGVTNAAPQAVYQSERYGNSTYTFPGLTASASYTVRLHFAELYWTATGRRRFGVAINGTSVLSNFDIYATAGANYKAVVREFGTTANASGQIVVSFTNVTDNASICGIEILN